MNSSALPNYASSVLLYLSRGLQDGLKLKGLMPRGGTVPSRERAL